MFLSICRPSDKHRDVVAQKVASRRRLYTPPRSSHSALDFQAVRPSPVAAALVPVIYMYVYVCHFAGAGGGSWRQGEEEATSGEWSRHACGKHMHATCLSHAQ